MPQFRTPAAWYRISIGSGWLDNWYRIMPSVYPDLVAISPAVDSVLLLLFFIKLILFFIGVCFLFQILCCASRMCVCVCVRTYVFIYIYIYICFLLGPVYLDMESPVLKPLSLIIYWVIMTTPETSLGDKVNDSLFRVFKFSKTISPHLTHR